MNGTEIKSLERFIGIVEEEAGLYARMPAILERERRAVAVADHPGLSRICAEKAKLIDLIQGLENQRMAMLGELAKMASGPREKLTLTRLSGMVPEPYASRIEAAGERLSTLIRRIQEASRTNGSLIEHHLQLVKGAIAFSERSRKPHQVYHRSGEVTSVRQTGRVFSGKI
jgi:flagellar biosynthesis/type III secretory pathway chaperone